MGRRGRRDADFDDTLEQSYVAKRSKLGGNDGSSEANPDADADEEAVDTTTTDEQQGDAAAAVAQDQTKIEKLRLKKQERKDRKKAKAQERKIQEQDLAKERAEAKKETPVQCEMVTCRKGVQYQDVILGKGPVLQDCQKVHVQYTLRKANAKGKLIDSSDDFGFRVGRGEVIEGWDIGMGGMRQGGKRRLFVPPEAGYGMKDIGAGKGGMLYFEVSLLSC
jgi:FKBP-type peptidyl-prolyl cis-trans isomerase